MRKYARIGSAAAAAMILAGCGGGSHSGTGTDLDPQSSGPGTSSSAALAFDINRIQTAAARQIEKDQKNVGLTQTEVRCPTDIYRPEAGTKFECKINAEFADRRANMMIGTGTIVLNDAAGKTFSLDYKMKDEFGTLSLSGTDSSVG